MPDERPKSTLPDGKRNPAYTAWRKVQKLKETPGGIEAYKEALELSNADDEPGVHSRQHADVNEVLASLGADPFEDDAPDVEAIEEIAEVEARAEIEATGETEPEDHASDYSDPATSEDDIPDEIKEVVEEIESEQSIVTGTLPDSWRKSQEDEPTSVVINADPGAEVDSVDVGEPEEHASDYIPSENDPEELAAELEELKQEEEILFLPVIGEARNNKFVICAKDKRKVPVRLLKRGTGRNFIKKTMKVRLDRKAYYQAP